MELRKRINAWILLGLFVPLMMTASLHRHEVVGEQETLCEACVHHQAHSGHLSSGFSCGIECIFCQFLTFSFIKATAICVAALTMLGVVMRRADDRPYAYLPVSYKSSRAPPFIL